MNNIITKERLEQKRREKLDPDLAHFYSQYGHDGHYLKAQVEISYEEATKACHRRQKANYEVLENDRKT